MSGTREGTDKQSLTVDDLEARAMALAEQAFPVTPDAPIRESVMSQRRAQLTTAILTLCRQVAGEAARDGERRGADDMRRHVERVARDFASHCESNQKLWAEKGNTDTSTAWRNRRFAVKDFIDEVDRALPLPSTGTMTEGVTRPAWVASGAGRARSPQARNRRRMA